MDAHLNGPEDALILCCGIFAGNILDGKEMARSMVSQARLKPLQGITALSFPYTCLHLIDPRNTNTRPLIIILELRRHEKLDVLNLKNAGCIDKAGDGHPWN